MKPMSAPLFKYSVPAITLTFLAAFCFVIGVLTMVSAQAQTQPTPQGATKAVPATQPAVYFAAPANGVTVTNPFLVKFGVTGMEVRPAGDSTANTGHHHLIINDGPVKKGDVIPTDDHHLHYGKGQTEAEISLPPGTYALTLQFANGLHQSYGADLSKTITVTVK